MRRGMRHCSSKGKAVRLPVPQARPLQAIHLSDPDRVLVLVAADDGRTFATLYDRRSTPWRALASLQDVSQLRLDRVSGQDLLTRLTGGGLWQIAQSLAADTLQSVDPLQPSCWRYRSWAPGVRGQLHYLSSNDTCATYGTELRGGFGQCLDAADLSDEAGCERWLEKPVLAVLHRRGGVPDLPAVRSQLADAVAAAAGRSGGWKSCWLTPSTLRMRCRR